MQRKMQRVYVRVREKDVQLERERERERERLRERGKVGSNVVRCVVAFLVSTKEDAPV